MSLIDRIQTSRTLSRAQKLASNGRAQEAIAQLRSANRKRANPALERAVVDLLLQTRSEKAADTPRGDAARETLAHAADIRDGTIPEVPASEFTVEILREAIDRAGYLIVRGFFNSADSAEIRECIDASLNARVEAEAEADNNSNAWYYPSPHFPGTHKAFAKLKTNQGFSRTGSIMVIDSPRGSFRVLEIYRKHGLKKLLEAYFGEPAVLATRKWVFRLVEPRDLGHGIGGGWHQDGRFMGEGIRALNMWVALSECGAGTDSPGITLLPKRITEILETGTRGANIDWVVPGALVEELNEESPIVNPHFNTGDALFFDHYSLHRSGHEPGLTRNRYALESWFYANTAIADNAVIDLI